MAMPVKSNAQNRAMQAAKHGRSTLGIPKSVAKEFLKGGVPKGLPEKVSKTVATNKMTGAEMKMTYVKGKRKPDMHKMAGGHMMSDAEMKKKMKGKKK